MINYILFIHADSDISSKVLQYYSYILEWAESMWYSHPLRYEDLGCKISPKQIFYIMTYKTRTQNENSAIQNWGIQYFQHKNMTENKKFSSNYNFFYDLS